MLVVVWIVTSRTSEARISRVVAAAVVQAIGLEPNVVDTPEVRHCRNNINTAMASATVLLRQRLGIQRPWIEDKRVRSIACLEKHRDCMFLSGAVAGFASDSRSQQAEVELPAAY